MTKEKPYRYYDTTITLLFCCRAVYISMSMKPGLAARCLPDPVLDCWKSHAQTPSESLVTPFAHARSEGETG